ncbi:MAG: PIG-L deacetylase family protein [Armatimonadota bacterium]
MADDLRVLAVVAHPDDESLLSGTLALQSRAGIDVTLAVACNGNMGGLMGAKPQVRAQTRHEEMQQVCEVLGVSLEWLDYGDDDFMEHYHDHYQEMEMAFRNLVRRVDPQLLITLSPDDYHHHHRLTAGVTLNASINAGNANIKNEEPASGGIPITLHCAPMPGCPFEPTMYVDIGETFEVKIEALKAHKSQHQYLEDHHKTDIFAQTEAAARYYGSICGVNFAESFAFVRRFNRAAPINQLAPFFPTIQT